MLLTMTLYTRFVVLRLSSPTGFDWGHSETTKSANSTAKVTRTNAQLKRESQSESQGTTYIPHDDVVHATFVTSLSSSNALDNGHNELHHDSKQRRRTRLE